MKLHIHSIETVTEEDGREVLLFGTKSTSESKELAKDILGEEVEIRRPIDRARLIYLWEQDDFAGLLKYLNLY